MKYFIIGGAGFIGSNFARYLVSQGHSVFIHDNFTTGRQRNLEGIDHIRCELEEGIEYCDYIIHLAASVGVEYVNNDVLSCMHNNLDMERRVFVLNSIHQKPLLFASTSEVYGNSNRLPFKEHDPLEIGEPSQGRWGYACSKLMGEFLALHASFPAVVVRFFNVTGPGQLPDYGMVLPKFINAGLDGHDIEVYGDGSAIRCFCHIDDAVVVLQRLVEDSNCHNQVFNIGNPDNKICMSALAKKVLRMTGTRSTIKKIDFGEVFKKNPTDIINRAPSITKVTGLTGWKPVKSIDDIIEDMVEYEAKSV